MPIPHIRSFAQLRKTRRFTLMSFLVVLSGLAAAAPSVAQQTDFGDVMFVQSAPGVTYDPATRKLTLQDANLVTVFFASGKPPLAGKMLTSRFVEVWNTQIASSLTTAPVADLSFIDAGDIHQTIIALSSPTIEDDNLVYQVVPGENEIKLTGGDATLFIELSAVPEALFTFTEGSSGMFQRAELK